jgi:hypothetical protein
MVGVVTTKSGMTSLLPLNKDFGCFSLRHSMSVENSRLFVYDDLRPYFRTLMDGVHRANLLQVAINVLLLEDPEE